MIILISKSHKLGIWNFILFVECKMIDTPFGLWIWSNFMFNRWGGRLVHFLNTPFNWNTTKHGAYVIILPNSLPTNPNRICRLGPTSVDPRSFDTVIPRSSCARKCGSREYKQRRQRVISFLPPKPPTFWPNHVLKNCFRYN